MIYFVRFPEWFPYIGVALWPFIFIRKDYARKPANVIDMIINHEKIHLRQQCELLFVGFLFIYLLEYLVGLITERTHDAAYLSISFEREAYVNQSDKRYLENRPAFAWAQYWV